MNAPNLTCDERFKTNQDRVDNRDTLVPILEDYLVKRKVSDWLKDFREAGVPAAPVNNLDAVFSEPPVSERQMIVDYEHPEVGKVRLPGNPIKMDGMMEAISNPAPLLGEHTEELLKSLLHLSPKQVKELKDSGAIS